MGYDINWHALAGDPVLKSVQYQKYSIQAFTDLNLPEVQGDILAAKASNESAAVINYLMWLVRVIQAAS
jgi:hypothetical protein